MGLRLSAIFPNSHSRRSWLRFVLHSTSSSARAFDAHRLHCLVANTASVALLSSPPGQVAQTAQRREGEKTEKVAIFLVTRAKKNCTHPTAVVVLLAI